VIFVTVGTELAFDRMIRPIDEWAGRNKRTDVFAQIGPTNWHPQNIAWAKFVDAPECRQRIAKADLVVAHAGMGTILIARELGKPIVVMPRRAALNEHRTDHQLGTVRELASRGGVVPAMTEADLLEILDNPCCLPASDQISPYAPREFLDKIRDFVELGVATVGSGISAARIGPERFASFSAARGASAVLNVQK
jgi:UDP-N-acetylglucosamine transferase subunit ALG13